jgi:hypothetical protein
MHEDLNRFGLVEEEDNALEEAALSLALPDHPGTNLAPYHDLLGAMETQPFIDPP